MRPMKELSHITVLCVGNRLMLDDGAGPAVFDHLTSSYAFPPEVELVDAGCMTMALLPKVMASDYVIAVDAIDGTGAKPGTVFRFAPEDIAGHDVMQSLHDMRLVDLINAAELMGGSCSGMCFGVQAENMSPAVVTEGLTPAVFDALGLLCDAVLAHLWELGVRFSHADGTAFVPPMGASKVCGAPCSDGRSDELEFSATLASRASDAAQDDDEMSFNERCNADEQC